MLFWKITLKQFRSSSSYTQPYIHNFCEGPQPQRLNIALCRPTVLRPCYVWESHKYHCFYYITTVSITRLYLFCGNIWGAFKWEKQRKYIKRGRYKILYEVTCNTLLANSKGRGRGQIAIFGKKTSSLFNNYKRMT